ncbi:MAG: phosphate ABC transporter substrate-binding protein [Methylococcales bacterium]|nr:phosphate ABC transporter substrate-binding protein [Methylococcales bacterium]
MKKLGIVVTLIVLTGAVWGLLRIQSNETKIEKLVLTGSSTIAPLAAEIGKRFESFHSNVRVDVQTGGSSRGISDARAGLANIGMASRGLKEDEKDLLNFTIALDGVSIILNKSNPVNALDKQQIIDIYTGKIANWKEVGGNDAAITVVSKAEGRSTLELFLHYFSLKNTDIKPQVIIGDNQQGIKTVAGNPDAIGYVSVGAAEYEAGQGAVIKLLPLAGIAASVENVRNRSFPLSRPLNLVTRGEPGGVARQFIDFASSPQVNDLIEAQFFVPVAH